VKQNKLLDHCYAPNYDAPSVVLFEKYLLAASSLVLIFFKKVGFSLTKVGKVMMPFHIKTYIDFMLNQEEDFSDSVRHVEGGTIVPASA
jgi:hypothetical protein